MTENQFKCRCCAECNGLGCVGELPGMGGVDSSRNFQLNCSGWKDLFNRVTAEEQLAIAALPVRPSNIRCAPVTGAEQNIGYARESDFYLPYVYAAREAGIGLCVGDGCPDEKLLFGVDAVRTLQHDDHRLRAAFFIKPYTNSVMLDRISWTEGCADIIGSDIDAYNIVTMRNQAHLEKKTAALCAELRRSLALPFALKGIFTKEDVELVKSVKPDIAYISNHGGRVEAQTGSTAAFLAAYGKMLNQYCGELWVDGGIRTKRDVQTALYFGAAQVIIARPFISALISGGTAAMISCARSFSVTES